MLKYLHIENIAIIEKSDIEFSDGLTVMTGETGAGKSIVIDALNAVLGERTSKEFIRHGCSKAYVSALFTGISEAARNEIEENGFELDNGELLVTRIFNSNGNGTVKINGKTATVGILKSITRNLVDIHGQHDNRNLLDEHMHLSYIDKIAENFDLKNDYYKEFKRLNAIRKELSALETDNDEKQRKLELLQFQINELENADIKCGEIVKLKKQLEIAESFEKTSLSLNKVLTAVRGTDENDGVNTVLTSALRELSSVNIESIQNESSVISDAVYGLENLCDNIDNYLNNADYNPEKTEEIRERLDFLYRIMLKYGDSEEKLLSYLDDAKKEFEKIKFSDKRIEELSLELDASTEALIELAEKLTASRKRAADIFEKQICDGLKTLDMPNVRFAVDFQKGKYSKNGCDEVSFLISANSGEEPRPLSKIASGGELSRIMLVIKQVLADRDDVDTMIFDEIDTGISGNAANKVGIMLHSVACNRQVICVTHLAQIAAVADNHLLIEKYTEDSRTFTKVNTLSYSQQIKEIARIMAGGDLSENILNSAKELLDRSKTNGNL